MELTSDLIYASLKGENAALREVYTKQQALILQLVEALEDFDDAGPPGEGWKSAPLLSLLASARARLEHSTQACK